MSVENGGAGALGGVRGRGWQVALGLIGVLGLRPGLGHPDRLRGRLGQALRGDDVLGAAGSPVQQAQDRLQRAQDGGLRRCGDVAPRGVVPNDSAGSGMAIRPAL